MSSLHTVRWRGLSSATRESCEVTSDDDDGVRVRGRVDGPFGSCVYLLHADADWRFRSVTLDLGGRMLSVAFDGAGWSVDGEPRPELGGALEPDLSVSPLTNTLPIRRLDLAVGESGDIVTAFIAVPELTVQPDPQRYTRLAPDRYLYESRDTDFRREITVDGAGLVVDYPGLFERDDPPGDATRGG